MSAIRDGSASDSTIGRLAGGSANDRAELSAGRTEAAGIRARGRLRIRHKHPRRPLVGRPGACCGVVQGVFASSLPEVDPWTSRSKELSILLLGERTGKIL